MSNYARDLVERALWAFVEGAAAGLVLTSLNDVSMWASAGLGGLTASISLVKSSLASRRGNPDSASLSKKI
jgi:hypothetical protein